MCTDRYVAGSSRNRPPVILGPVLQSPKERSAFVVLRRWRGDRASTVIPGTATTAVGRGASTATATPAAARGRQFGDRPAHADGAPPGGGRYRDRGGDRARPTDQRLPEKREGTVAQ